MHENVAAVALLFAASAGICRGILRTTLTRIQIFGFWLAAALFEPLIRPALGHPASWTGYLANGFASLLAMVGAKWWIEGLPYWLPRPNALRRK